MTPADVLWSPSPTRAEASELTRYRKGAPDYHGGEDYLALWRWSTADPGRFWESIADFESVDLGGTATGPVAPTEMPGARWFPGRTLNYAQHLLRDDPGGAQAPALIVVDDDDRAHPMSWGELRRQVAALSATMRAMGVGHGDRVVAVLPNRAEAVIGLLACASIGAIWSVCSPEFGPQAVLSRFAQLTPKVVLLTDGYHYGGRAHDRGEDMAAIVAGLPSIEQVIWVEHLQHGRCPDLGRPVRSWAEATAHEVDLVFDAVAFDHPLWVLFSSGTTGAPKGIVHGHGGALLEHLKVLRLHSDLRPGDRYLNVASTSWVVWNMLVSGLAVGATIVLLDGNPVRPDLSRVWKVADQEKVHVLGLSAGYVHACLKAGLSPQLGVLRTLQVTGSPLSSAGFTWVHEHFDDVWLSSMSGGTDVCSIFVGGVPTLPVRRGRIQAPALGVAVEAWDAEGHQVGPGQRGELVITAPMPSMPLYFWNDPEGRRYRDSYFTMFSGVWRHGDFIAFEEDGSSVILGRSDSTLNRHGIRMGPADIYQVVEALPEIREALVVGAELGEEYYMPLFVALEAQADPDSARERIRCAIRDRLSPRHLPDEIVWMRAIPHTRTGKKLEVPVKCLLQGSSLSDVVDLGAVDDSDLLHEYAAFARRRTRK